MGWSMYKPAPVDTDLYEKRICDLSKKCNTYPFLVQILINRGYNDDEIQKILLSPIELLSTTRLKNALEAGKMIFESIENNENIAIFADYDCDGITSGYVMTDGLRKIRDIVSSNSKIIVYYPERAEGYGLSMDFAKKCVDKNISLVITVDNGISAIEPAKFLKNNKIKLVVTDHHPFSSEDNCKDILKYADVVVNPAAINDIPDRSYLAGVGVAWDVLRCIANDIIPEYKININQYVDIVATGTISDVMPMSAENIGIIKIGLCRINNADSPPSFLKEYKQNGMELTQKDIAWTIAPEINAAGRIDSVWIAARALFDKSNIKENVLKLGDINNKRKQVTEKMMSDFYDMKFTDNVRFIVFIVSDTDPIGLLGLIAGKMMDVFPFYPCFACIEDKADNTLRGSVRCNPCVPLKSILTKAKNRDLILGYAGHDSACVLNLKSSKLSDFIDFFNTEYDSLDMEFPALSEEPEIYYDYEASLAFVTETFMQLINSVPYAGGMEPIIRINNLLVIEYKQTKSGGGFLKLSDDTATKKIFVFKEIFNKYISIGRPNQVDILGNIEQDFMSKKPKATIRVIDINPSEKSNGETGNGE